MRTFWGVVATTLLGVLIVGFMVSMMALVIRVVEGSLR